jgi:hypothetical protein
MEGIMGGLSRPRIVGGNNLWRFVSIVNKSMLKKLPGRSFIINIAGPIAGVPCDITILSMGLRLMPGLN